MPLPDMPPIENPTWAEGGAAHRGDSRDMFRAVSESR
jgi:hypothetical protein